MHIQGYRITGRFTIACGTCGGNTTLKYARKHDGQCKRCAEPTDTIKTASREEQHARYIDCGPNTWDDK